MDPVEETTKALDFFQMDTAELAARHRELKAEFEMLQAKRDKLPADAARMHEIKAETDKIAEAWNTFHDTPEVDELTDPEMIGNRKREERKRNQKAADPADPGGPGEPATPATPAKKAEEEEADGGEETEEEQTPAEPDETDGGGEDDVDDETAGEDSEETSSGEAADRSQAKTEAEAAKVVVPDDISGLEAPKELVAANAPVGKVTKVRERARRPFSAIAASGGTITSAAELMEEFKMAAASRARIPRRVATFSPYEGGTPGVVLGSNADENFRTLYGNDGDRVRTAAFGGRGSKPENGRNSFTAALNCAGPAEPIQELPFCYRSGRPLEDSGLLSMFEATNGQIQLYGCHQLPEVPDLLPVGDCGDQGHACSDCEPDSLECYTAQCLTPDEPMTPDRYVSCMCIPESLTFSNALAFDRALEDFAIATDRMYELMWMDQIRALSLIRTVDGAALPEHGAFSTVVRSIHTIGARLASDCRCENGLSDYVAYIPCGESIFHATMIDKMSRVLGCDCPGEDILQTLSSQGVEVVFGLDQDPLGAAVAEGFTAPWTDETPGVPAPLEDIPNAGTIYLIPRDTLGTASPLKTELGLEFKDHCQVHTGCLKLTRSEWWFPVFKVGCKQPIVLDYTNLGTCGTGPDLTVCS